MDVGDLTLTPPLAAMDLLGRRAAGVGGGKPLWVADSAVPDGVEQVRAFASAMGGGESVLAGREATPGGGEGGHGWGVGDAFHGAWRGGTGGAVVLAAGGGSVGGGGRVA